MKGARKRHKRQLAQAADRALPAHQLATGYATAAEWDDPDDTGRQGSYVRQVRGFRRADPLVTLHRHNPREVTAQHLRAAERLRDDHEMGLGVMRRAGTGSGDIGIITVQMAAAARYRAAVVAVGPSLMLALLAVVIQGWAVVRYATAAGMPDVRAKGYVLAALDRLRDHYDGDIS